MTQIGFLNSGFPLFNRKPPFGALGGGGGGGPTPDPTIGVPVLSLGVAPNAYPPTLKTPLPVDWQAGVTSLTVQATTVADADAGWLSPFINHTHVLTEIEATSGPPATITVPGLSAIVTPAVTVFRARAEQGGAFGNWSNELIHGDVAAPAMTSSLTPAARSELVDSIVYVATFDEKVTITGFGGADGTILVAEAPTVPATSHNIRRIDGALLNYASKTSYGFTISAKDRANNSVTTAAITAAVKDEVPTGFVGFFTDVTGATASTLYTAANTYTVAGLTAGVAQPITITGGEYRVDPTGTGTSFGAWTTAAGSVQNGHLIQVRGTSSGVGGGVTNVAVTIAGTTETFSITNTGAFDPVSLFGGADTGYYYNVSVLSSLWSDTAGTTPAVVDGPVRRIDDLSGKGNHALFITGNTLTLRQSGSIYYLEAVAANGATGATIAMPQPWTRISAIQIKDWNAFDRVFGAVGAGEGVLRQEGSSPQVMVNDGTSAPAVSPALNTNNVISEVHNNASSSLRLNNAAPVTGTAGANASTGVVIFNRSAGDRAVQGFFYGMVGITRALTAGEEANCRTFFAALYGGTL